MAASYRDEWCYQIVNLIFLPVRQVILLWPLMTFWFIPYNIRGMEGTPIKTFLPIPFFYKGRKADPQVRPCFSCYREN